MNLLITGGSGLIGAKLVEQLKGDNQITVLTRHPQLAEEKLGTGLTFITELAALNNLDEFDGVINLAGEPIVNKRWSAEQKALLENSRWDITRQLGELFAASDSPPSVLVSGSAIGFYGRQDSQIIDESFDKPNIEFSHELCATWETLALEIETDKTRVCVLRTGIVLAKHGGALAKMELPFKLGLGGPIGNGKHYMSWIHIDDMVRGIVHLIQHSDCSGVYNFTAPNPMTNIDFSNALASALHRPCILCTPKFALKLAMGEMADLLIYGQRVIPKRLQENAFTFNFTTIEDAFADLY
ncbi:TIGR01777 family oxidoreductase [Aliiglaciecola sp. 3_MG-2023]|uniref:TIGR01777 family oxidoreductase n=1 Tax=Aliiglaciecola sp. 3_MG-2023 TaxID=3062644 RepID=UPI0026E1B967|nr:TIGR01777 family oxidoreductase [Aliiglaciecola sp. 3_MG-2023]MDO6691982.1 TIGR01777 family oxidoreductase [Aliiglaciecola sp. 3_MG-2023]